MDKMQNKKLYKIFIWLVIFIYIFPSCSILFNSVSFAVEPGERIDIEQSIPQYGGNLEGEITNYNWGYTPGELYAIWQREGGTTDEGYCYISAYGYDWILVACSDSFGVDGDYLQVHVNHDGVETDYPMIMFDTKNPNDGYAHIYDSKGMHLGHAQGSEVDILEFPYHGKTPGNLLDFKNVEYIVNGGSFLNGEPQGLDFTGKSSSGGSGNASFWGTLSKVYSGVLDAIYTGFENLFKNRDDMTVAYDLNEKDDAEGKGGSSKKRGNGDILQACKEVAEMLAARGCKYPGGGGVINYALLDTSGDINKQLYDSQWFCCATYVAAVLYYAGVLTEEQVNAFNYHYTGSGGIPDMLEAANWIRVIPPSDMQPGDVVVDVPHHVLIYAGNGQYWDQASAVTSTSGVPPTLSVRNGYSPRGELRVYRKP